MGDLISRKALIENLKNRLVNVNYHPDLGDIAVGMEQELHNEFLLYMIEEVENQPCIYDKYKIAEQLYDYLFEKYCIEGDSEIERILMSNNSIKKTDRGSLVADSTCQ